MGLRDPEPAQNAERVHGQMSTRQQSVIREEFAAVIEHYADRGDARMASRSRNVCCAVNR
jgi:cation transport regulator ChaB